VGKSLEKLLEYHVTKLDPVSGEKRTPSSWSNMEALQSCYGGALLSLEVEILTVYEGHYEFFEVSSHFGKDGDTFGAETEA